MVFVSVHGMLTGHMTGSMFAKQSMLACTTVSRTLGYSHCYESSSACSLLRHKQRSVLLHGQHVGCLHAQNRCFGRHGFNMPGLGLRLKVHTIMGEDAFYNGAQLRDVGTHQASLHQQSMSVEVTGSDPGCQRFWRWLWTFIIITSCVTEPGLLLSSRQMLCPQLQAILNAA
jgi:hypothetical protein